LSCWEPFKLEFRIFLCTKDKKIYSAGKAPSKRAGKAYETVLVGAISAAIGASLGAIPGAITPLAAGLIAH